MVVNASSNVIDLFAMSCLVSDAFRHCRTLRLCVLLSGLLNTIKSQLSHCSLYSTTPSIIFSEVAVCVFASLC